jgi:2-methylcitrate dehydratase PrpD
VDDIREIVIRGPQLIADQHMLADPASTMAAQYSCPYIVGATLAYGPRRYDAYSEAFLDDARIRAIAAKVRFELSEELTTYYPTRFATGVSFRFDDGTTRTAAVIDSVGTPGKPLTIDQIIAKGNGLERRAWGMEPNEPVGRRCATQIWDHTRGARALALTLMDAWRSLGTKA